RSPSGRLTMVPKRRSVTASARDAGTPGGSCFAADGRGGRIARKFSGPRTPIGTGTHGPSTVRGSSPRPGFEPADAVARPVEPAAVWTSWLDCDAGARMQRLH